MSKEKFYKDLKEGEIGERIVAEFLKTKGYEIIEYNKDIKWDVMVRKNGVYQTLEIKTDRWEYFNWVTNNMFIETYCNNKPSGISATSADWFIYFFPDWEIAYSIKVKDLRQLMNERGDIFRITKRAGDNGLVTGRLINRKEWGHLFKTFIIKSNWQWTKK